ETAAPGFLETRPVDACTQTATELNGGELLGVIASCKMLGMVRPSQLLILLFLAGCGSAHGELQQVWGKKGLYPGDFVRPRAIATDNRPGHERFYVVDFAGRIQVFDQEGKYLAGWRTPTIANGRPAGLGVSKDGDLLVADSHYHRILVYSTQG